MSINKHVDDHNITGIAQVSIRDRFRPCSRDSSGGRTTRKQSNAATENRTCKPTSCIGITPSECSLSKNKAMGTPSRLVFVVLDSLLGVPIALFFDKEHSLGVMPMHDVGLQVLFSVAALLNLVFSLFFRLMSPLSKDETGRGCSPVQFL